MAGVMQIDGVLLWRKHQPRPINPARSSTPPDQPPCDHIGDV